MNLLINNYVITKIQGVGSFGKVYAAIDSNLKHVALKVETKKKHKNRLEKEYKVYLDLNISYMPKLYSYIQTNDYNILVMELLGENLEELFNKYEKKFPMSTIVKLGLDMIHIIQKMHEAEFIHRDIKPNNFSISITNKHLYIMDFGLSKKYIKNGEHVSCGTIESVIGTLRYVSVNIHNGIEPSRRDDLESIGYILLYFLTHGCLPWQHLPKKSKKGNLNKLIGNIKQNVNLELFMKDYPHFFLEYIKYCRGLAYDETPNYEYIYSLFPCTSEKLTYVWDNN